MRVVSNSLISFLGLSGVVAVIVSLNGLMKFIGPTVVEASQQPDVITRRYEPFDVDVLVDGRPLSEYSARGRTFIEAERNAEYSVRIRNPLPVRVAVALSVDGLNTIDARRGTSWDSSKWVIEPYGTITVSGWQMSSEHARRFYFTTERDSYAAKLGRASDMGLISAVFYREQSTVSPYPVRPPYITNRRDDSRVMDEKQTDERLSSARGEAKENSRRRNRAILPQPDDEHAATGIGRRIYHDVRWVNLKLDPRPAAEITIRYEYADALTRLGIFPRRQPAPTSIDRRERARGFEDSRYSPEP